MAKNTPKKAAKKAPAKKAVAKKAAPKKKTPAKKAVAKKAAPKKKADPKETIKKVEDIASDLGIDLDSIEVTFADAADKAIDAAEAALDAEVQRIVEATKKAKKGFFARLFKR